MRTLWHLFIFFAALLTSNAQILTNGQSWHYQLTDGSAYTEDLCPECETHPPWQRLTGSFDLVGTATPGLYAITNFVGRRIGETIDNGPIGGSGSLRFESGSVVITLNALIRSYDFTYTVPMTNAVSDSSRTFPMIEGQVDESDGNINLLRRIRVFAAPIRDLWFFTSLNFTNATLGQITQGDLLSMAGRIVKRKADLINSLSISSTDVGLNSFDVGPHGEIFFSTATKVASSTVGEIGEGDIVTSSGRAPFRISQLLSSFNAADSSNGIDGIQIVSPDEIYFSLRDDIVNDGQKTLRRGDILSSKGRIIATEASLFERFAFIANEPDFGVGPFFIWPNGEIWFSPQEEFATVLHHDNFTTLIWPMDIISSHGYIVYSSAESLLEKFVPDIIPWDQSAKSFTVISDITAIPGFPVITNFKAGISGVDIGWSSTSGRIFQVERFAISVDGHSHFSPVTDLSIDSIGRDPVFFKNSYYFYHVRQW